MGLFDVFRAKIPELNPRIALAVGLLFMTSADGAIEQEEFGVLLANLHGDERLLDDAMLYGKATKFDDYLSASANLLNEPQKISRTKFQPHLDVIIKKNDHSVLK